MSDIDELMTQFRRYLPEADPADGQRAARRVRERPSPPARRGRLRLTGRRLVAAAGALGAAVLLFMLVVLFVVSEKGSEPASLTGWGLEAMVAVTPGPGGLDLDAATDRTVDVLNASWRAEGLDGVDARRLRAGLVGVVASQAKRADQVENLLRGLDLRLYNPADAIVDTADPAEVARVLRARATPGSPAGAFVALATGPSPRLFRANFIGRTEEEVRALFGGELPDGVEVVGIPNGLRLIGVPPLDDRAVQRFEVARYLLVDDRPMLRAEDFVEGRAADGYLFLATAPEARAGLARAMGRTLTGPGFPILVSVDGPQTDVLGLAEPGGQDGSLKVEPARGAGDAAQLARRWPAGGVTASLGVTSTAQVGNVPTITGDAVATLPQAVARSLGVAGFAGHPPTGASGAIAHDAVRRVLTTDAAGDRFDLYGAQAAWGEDFFWLAHGSRSGRDAVLGPLGTCDPEPGHPGITSCATVGNTAIPHTLGRVGQGVTRVEARYAERAPADATVANGWFLLFLDPDPRVVPTEIVALDGTGRVVGRLTRDQAALAPRTGTP